MVANSARALYLLEKILDLNPAHKIDKIKTKQKN